MKKTGKSPKKPPTEQQEEKKPQKRRNEFETSMDPITFNDLYGFLSLVDPKTRKPRHDGIHRYERSWNIFSILSGTIDKDKEVFLDVSHNEFLEMYCFQVAAANKNIADWFVSQKVLTKDYVRNIPNATFEGYESIVMDKFDVDIYQLIDEEQFNDIAEYLENMFDREFAVETPYQDEY